MSNKCTACQAGNYCLVVGSSGSVMTACSAGTYQTSTKQSSCIDCPAGYYCANGIAYNAPVPCPDGFWSNSKNTLAATCFACPIGFYCKGGSQIACTAVNQYCPLQSAAPITVTSGYYSGSLQTTCGGSSCKVYTYQSICEAVRYCLLFIYYPLSHIHILYLSLHYILIYPVPTTLLY